MAAYANFRWGGEVFASSSVTLAYGQLLNAGNPDRDYLYFQAMLRPADGFFFSGSTEFDLHVMQSGERVRKLRLTNTFVTLMYTPPFQWVSLSAGYDAARSIYLFESMKFFPDSLMDRTLREGFRGSVSFSLPARIILMGNGSFRLKTRTTGPARTLSGSARAADIFGSGIGAGAAMADIRGLYTSGSQYTVDCDAWFANGSGAALRYDRYLYRVQESGEQLVATTLGISLNQRIAQTLYAAVSYDRIWEQENRSWRLYAEMGIHF
jgi:hypothetical protein